MSIENYQFWNLILGAFTAFGTVGAVIISLYVTIWPKKKFKIHNVEVKLEYKTRVPNGSSLNKSLIVFNIENKCDVQMQIFDVNIDYLFKDGKFPEDIPCGHGVSFVKCFIPAKSRYNAATQIPHHDLPNGTMNKVKTIKLRLGTSFGEETLDLPQEWLSNYTMAIEKPEEEQIKEEV